MSRFIAVLTAVLVSGCAGLGQIESVSDLSSQQLKQVNSIKLYENDAGLKYTSLGKIKGLSCKGSALSSTAEKEEAMMQLKIKAVKAGANAILYPTCSHDASVDWSNNCWDSWVCVGEAIVTE
mgnify:CR=1 FL=1